MLALFLLSFWNSFWLLDNNLVWFFLLKRSLIFIFELIIFITIVIDYFGTLLLVFRLFLLWSPECLIILNLIWLFVPMAFKWRKIRLFPFLGIIFGVLVNYLGPILLLRINLVIFWVLCEFGIVAKMPWMSLIVILPFFCFCLSRILWRLFRVVSSS